MNWPGIFLRTLYAILATLALTGWMFFGWGMFFGVVVGFLLAVMTIALTKLTESGYDPWAWKMRDAFKDMP